MTAFRPFAILSAVTLITACAVQPQQSCPASQKIMVNDTLYFGTAIPVRKAVSADEWRQFIDSEVTPRFGQGLSFWQASGQWKSEAGTIIRESSYVLNLVHPESEATEAAVREIMNAYKTRFRQEAVLRVSDNSCVSF